MAKATARAKIRTNNKQNCGDKLPSCEVNGDTRKVSCQLPVALAAKKPAERPKPLK